MRKRIITLTMLMLVLTIGITAQKLGRRMMVNYGGEVVATYNLPQNIDSLTFATYKFYEVIVSSSDETMGTVTTSATEVEVGRTTILKATPVKGYAFVNWTVNGEEVSIENPYTATITANSEFVANFKLFEENYVDLGLPSGIKWATCNVGADSPEEYGDYFAWGETTPKTTYNWSTYKYCNGNENSLTKYCVDSDYGTVDNKTILERSDDAAHVNWGGNWRMPTRTEQEELMDTNNCTWTWTTQNGVNGYKVTSVKNGNSIFLPAAGHRDGGILYNEGECGDYCSSTLFSDESDCAYELHFESSWVSYWISIRECGLPVRAVYGTTSNGYLVSVLSSDETMGTVATSATEVEEGEIVTLTATPNEGYKFVNWILNGEVVSTENPYTTTITANSEFVANFEIPLSEPTGTENGYGYVDLGLPSGLKWATCNVGANTPEEYGDYFAWGETEPKDNYSSNFSNYKYCNGSATTLTKYCTSSKYGKVDNKTTLELEDDAAYVNWGGEWRMPTKAELEELINPSNCTWTWTTKNGVKGYNVTSVKNGNSIFLPAAGYRNNVNLNDVGRYGNYWLSSLYTDGSYAADCLSFDSTDEDCGATNRARGHSVRAVCDPTPVYYAITVSSSDETMGTVATSATEVEEGETVTLTATPNEGYEFVNWTVNGEVVSTENPYTATITEDTEFVANFEYVLSEPTGTENGYGYVDLGLPCGLKWATCNVGANTPEEYGDYFAWGETTTKSSYSSSNYKYSSNPSTLPLSADAANVNWGGAWRMPTDDELHELASTSNCLWILITQNGVKGYKVISVKNGNSIFLPAAGYYQDGNLEEAGSSGYYWSSLRGFYDSNSINRAISLEIYSGSRNCYEKSRYNGRSVRAVYDPTPVYYAITVSSSDETMGTVTASANEVAEGETVTLTATPKKGYKFENWTLNGEVVSTENPYTATITANTEFVANFEVNPIKDPINSLSNDELVYVEGGTFTMGATSEQGSVYSSDERPTHSVTLSSYYIGKYEVTQQLWEYVMSYRGKAADGTTMTAYASDVWLEDNPSSSFGLGNNYPAYDVSYDDIVNIFLPRLNKITGGNYRLPTEAEWEYAARGGKKSKGYKYSGSNNIEDVAWYESNSGLISHAVGTKQPNELGIYDMSGNVREWCSDWYGSYSSSAQTNPTGPTSGSYRVERGGYWRDTGYCRVSDRNYSTPAYRYFYTGFRLASGLKP